MALLYYSIAACAVARMPFPPVSFHAAPQKPTVALAVQRLAFSDASRCLDELCRIDDCSPAELLHEGLHRLGSFVESRELIIRWGVMRWAEVHVKPLLPREAAAHFPSPHTLTLPQALAPLKWGGLTRTAFMASPFRVFGLAWQLALLWAARLMLPAEVARRRRRESLPKTMWEIASTYDALR